MTGRPTFGEFAAAATSHLRELQMRSTGLENGDRQAAADAIGGVRAAVHVLVAYTGDVCATFDAAEPASDHSLGPWRRAARAARQALSDAEAAWPDDFGQTRRAGSSLREPPSGLSAAVRYMKLGRDLLHTHLTSPIDRGESDWSAVISSAPAACVVLGLVGGWARQLAPHAARVSIIGGLSPADQRRLHATCRGLWIASWAIGTAQEHQPIRKRELHVVGAIPIAGTPPARLPGSRVTVPELCNGVTTTAERLRAAARYACAGAAWSPAVTRESLRQTAGCCAISASNLRIILRTLAEHRGTTGSPTNRTPLMHPVELANSARAAWLEVAGAWDSITTDTRGYRSPVATEAAALALWTGRLAYASPDWTPSLGPQHKPRPAIELADDDAKLRKVIDALDQTCHTLAVVAEADRALVRTAALHGRLIVPTRSLPDSFDIPYRFAPAPSIRTEPLLSSYYQALHASEQASGGMSQLSADIQAVGRKVEHAYQPARSASPDDKPRRQPIPPGPVERILLDLNVTSRADLEQAIAIDAASDQLILRAAASATASASGRDPSRSAGTAELITQLLVNSGGTITAALQPAEGSSNKHDGIGLVQHATTCPPVRQAQAELGA
jgi:hypothetical protein